MPRRPTPMMSPFERRLLLARTIYVDASATGTNDGTSWPTAYTDLQSALAIATSGDTIDVAQGTYKPTTSTDPSVTISSTFNLVDGVSLLGGFSGDNGTGPSARNPASYVTILSGKWVTRNPSATTATMSSLRVTSDRERCSTASPSREDTRPPALDTRESARVSSSSTLALPFEIAPTPRWTPR